MADQDVDLKAQVKELACVVGGLAEEALRQRVTPRSVAEDLHQRAWAVYHAMEEDE